MIVKSRCLNGAVALPAARRRQRKRDGVENAFPAAQAERVEAGVRETLPPALHAYVAWHPLTSRLWTLVPAIPQGRSQLVPALVLAGGDAAAGERYQLMAVVTRGLLPAEQLDYADLLLAAVATSNPAADETDFTPGPAIEPAPTELES